MYIRFMHVETCWSFVIVTPCCWQVVEAFLELLSYSHQPSLFIHKTSFEPRAKINQSYTHSLCLHSCNVLGLSAGRGHSWPTPKLHSTLLPIPLKAKKHTQDLVTGVAPGDTYSCGAKRLRRWGCIFYSSCSSNPYIPHSCTTSRVLRRGLETRQRQAG